MFPKLLEAASAEPGPSTPRSISSLRCTPCSLLLAAAVPVRGAPLGTRRSPAAASSSSASAWSTSVGRDGLLLGGDELVRVVRLVEDFQDLLKEGHIRALVRLAEHLHLP